MLIRSLLSERYRKLRLFSAFFLYMLMIVGGAIPGMRSEIGHIASGLILHSLSYSLIAFLLFSGLRGAHSIRVLKVFFLVALMGALDEGIQSFFPYRNGNIRDWLVDVSAAVITLSLLMGARLTASGRRVIGQKSD